MRVMQFNIQHGKNFLSKTIDLQALSDAIALLGADIVCLNEVYGSGPHPAFTAQAEELAKNLGFYSFFAPAIEISSSGPYGNALLSRYPILNAENVKVPTVPRNHPGYFEDRCAFCAQVDVNGKTLTVIGIHFGLQPEEQEECVKTVCALIDRADTPVILMGDFNVEPDDPVLTPIRQKLYDAASSGEGGQNTFPSDQPIKKIDYIFLSDSLTLSSSFVADMIVSDHLPVIADINI